LNEVHMQRGAAISGDAMTNPVRYTGMKLMIHGTVGAQI